jgi:hypothetical protein
MTDFLLCSNFQLLIGLLPTSLCKTHCNHDTENGDSGYNVETIMRPGEGLCFFCGLMKGPVSLGVHSGTKPLLLAACLAGLNGRK